VEHIQKMIISCCLVIGCISGTVYRSCVCHMKQLVGICISKHLVELLFESLLSRTASCD